MIIIDTEYTTWPGALENGWSSPGQHREIVQIAAIRVDEDFNEVEHFDLIVRPSINPTLSDLFIQLTKISQATVDTQGLAFSEALTKLIAFCSTEEIICMNSDGGVFEENCKLNSIDDFPLRGRFRRLRPLLEKLGIDLINVSSGDLHKMTPSPIQGHTHNALHDVRSMSHWLHYAQKSGAFKSVLDLPTDIPVIDPRRASSSLKR